MKGYSLETNPVTSDDKFFSPFSDKLLNTIQRYYLIDYVLSSGITPLSIKWDTLSYIEVASLTQRTPSDSLRKRIGQRIKHARKEQNLTQDEFAKAMGRSTRKWVWDVETGKVGLYVEDLILLSSVLKKPMPWILGEGPEQLSEQEELTEGYLLLPEEGRRWLIGSLRGMLQYINQ